MSRMTSDAGLNVIVVGGGGHAAPVIAALRAMGANLLGLVDARAPALGQSILGVPVLGDDTVLQSLNPERVRLANGIGRVLDGNPRRRVFDTFTFRSFRFIPIVHPQAIVADEVCVEDGGQIMAGAVVQPCCRIGANALVNTRASIDHNCVIGAHAHVAPGAVLCGSVRVGDGAHVGAGAVVIEGIQVGESAVVAAGATVVRDVLAGTIVFGTPAQVHKA
jgi:sugar O-acyltransferase (sialic acid O-acetyltransferase NeuD family)